jgi:N-acetylmuramoyl-L-alanine amidase
VRGIPAVAALLLLSGCAGAVAGHPSGVPRTPPQTSSAPAPSGSGTASSHGAARPQRRHSTAAARPSAARTTTAPPRLRGLTVVLNPGHNGGNAAHPDEIARLVPAGFGAYKACDTTGTETAAGYPEHAFNWDVAQRVARILRAAGVNVIMTRPDDTGVGPCVDQRAAIGNRPGVAAVVSIHADGAPADGHGFHVNQDSRIPDGATALTQQRSIALGRAIHDALVRSSGLVPSTYIGQDGYYYRSDLAGLNLATNPATFLELGNMKNPGDAALESSPAGRERIAAAVAAGILTFLGR